MARIAKYPMGCGIYAIEHIESGKRYIGSSQKMQRRISDHIWKLKGGTHHSPHLQSAWKCYGAAAFRFVLILQCESVGQLLEAEQLEIDMHGGTEGSYNVAPFAGAPMRGRKQSEETKAKMRATHADRAPISEETRGRHREAAIEREQQRKVDGYTMSEEGRANLSAALKGHAVSDETRRKLSEANRGKSSSPEHYKMLSKLYTGGKHADEHKAKIAASTKMWASPEAREAHSKRMKEHFAAKRAAKEQKQ